MQQSNSRPQACRAAQPVRSCPRADAPSTLESRASWMRRASRSVRRRHRVSTHACVMCRGVVADMHMGIHLITACAGPKPENLYEQARLERIAGNRAELARLGLNPGGRLCLRLSAPAPVRRGRPLKDDTLDSSGIAAAARVPARRSSRLTGPFAAPRGVCT